MQTGKKRTSEKTESTSLKVVVIENDKALIEREIEKNIKKIRSLIHKLSPIERQKYFDGLLSHILEESVETSMFSSSKNKKSHPNKDYSKLSFEEMKLIEELSIKMEHLYRTMQHDPS